MMLNRTKLGLAVVTALFLITGCEKQQTAEQHLSAAKTYITQSEASKAVIELKNSLSQNSKLDEARLLLGQLYLSNGDFLAAEIEFNKLYNTDYPTEQLIVDIAKARYLQQELDTIPDLWQERDNLSSAQTAKLGFYTYIALKRSENKQQLEKLKQILIPSKQDQTYTKLILAYEQAEKQQVNSAITTVDNILLAEPENIEALLFKGQLHVFKQQYAEASVAFEQFLQLMPNYILAELYLADALFKNKEFGQAKPHINKLAELAPNYGYTNYLKGMLAFTENNFQEAKLSLEKAVQAKVNVEQSKLFAGLSAYRTENYEQAYEYLAEVIDLIPANDELRRLLSVVQFKLGYNIEASDSIAKLNELSEKDLTFVNAASFNYIKEGEIDKAKALIEQASQVDSDNAFELTKLGMLKVSLQDMSGIVDIKNAIAVDSTSEQAKIALVQAYLSQNLAEDALAVALQWIKDEPDNVNSYNLAGFVALQKQDVKLAEQYFSKALEFNESNSASLMFLAGKAKAEGKLQAAVTYLNSLISANSDYLPGLINNYLISKQVGDVGSSIDLFKIASENSPSNHRLSLAYARVLYTEKMYDKVVNVLMKMPKLNVAEYRWLALFDSLFRLGRFDQARQEIEGWVSAFPKSEQAWSAAIQLDGLTTPKTAIPLIKRAISNFGDNPYLYTILAEQYIKARELDDAELILNNELTNHQQEPKVVVLQAKLLLINEQVERANALLQSVYSSESQPELAILLAESYRKLGNNQQALNIIETSLKTNPKNLGLLFNKGNLYKKIDINESIRIYNEILAIEPKSVVTLNNLANAHLATNEFELGYVTALKATELAPHAIAIQSTMADAARLNGKVQEAEKIYGQLWLATKTKQYLIHYMKLAEIESEQVAITRLNNNMF